MSWTVARWSEIGGLRHGFGGRDEAPPAPVRTLRQVHGADVYEVAAIGEGARPEGDGLIARDGDPAVGVHTADCVPVLILAPSARVAAAVHSGWRGTVAGVAERALAVLRDRFAVGASGVEAALGPAIGGCCYEVGEEVRDAFRARYGAQGGAGFSERDGSIRLDLRDVLATRLAAEGIRVERVGPCTFCDAGLHSYRRERGTGRQLSWIAWD